MDVYGASALKKKKKKKRYEKSIARAQHNCLRTYLKKTERKGKKEQLTTIIHIYVRYVSVGFGM
jgi:hypothetical protein